MRNHLINELISLAQADPRIVFLTGDLGYNVVEEFGVKCPGRFFNAGIAEQNMTAVAAGLALEGNIACTYSTGSFPTIRCLEQIRNCVCYHKANVKIIAVGGGFVYGQLGMSHHATEDIAAMRAMPNMTIFSPADPGEAVLAINEAVRINGPCYIRLGRGGEKPLHTTTDGLDITKIMPIRQGSDVAILSTGSVLAESLEAAHALSLRGISIGLANCVTLKPLDENGINALADRYKTLITLEEHNITGGLGSAVADILINRAPSAPRPRLIKLGLNDEFTSVVGSNAYLRDHYGLSARKIASLISNMPK